MGLTTHLPAQSQVPTILHSVQSQRQPPGQWGWDRAHPASDTLLPVQGSEKATVRRREEICPLGPERETWEDGRPPVVVNACSEPALGPHCVLRASCRLREVVSPTHPNRSWDTGVAGRAHSPQTLRVVAVGLPPAALRGLSGSHTRQAALMSVRWTGKTLSLSMVASSEPMRKECWSALQGRRPGFRCLSKQIGGFSFFLE